MLIKLTDNNGKEVLVNTAMITSVQDMGLGGNSQYVISFTTGIPALPVKEDLSTIKAAT